MIDRVGTIWGDNAEGRPIPIAVYRVGEHFRLSGVAGQLRLNHDSIDEAVAEAGRHFDLVDVRFGPTRLPVRDRLPERRGTHESYGWR